MASVLNFSGARGISSQGRSPITPAGRVVVNVIVDEDEARVRDQKIDSNRAAIQVATVPAVWCASSHSPPSRLHARGWQPSTSLGGKWLSFFALLFFFCRPVV